MSVSVHGDTLVFDLLGDLWTMPLAGGQATALTSGRAWDVEPRFSPDGARIAFVSDRGGNEQLWVMNADGSNPVQITKEKEHTIHTPTWSHDGQYIAVTRGVMSSRSVAAGEIWIYHHTGGSGSGVLEPPQCAQYNKVTRSYTGEFTKQQQGRATPTTHLTLGA